MYNKLKTFNRNKFTNIEEKNIFFMLIVVLVVKVNVTRVKNERY